MSTNQLNDISKVYLSQIAEETPTERIDRISKAGSKAYKAADHLKDNYEFARHKASVISRGGRLEDAVESWNQKVAHQEAMKEVSEKKEVNVKDTYKTVAAIVDYDRSKKGSEDATWDSIHGKKKEAEKERDYAKWERGKMKKDDPNWKHKKDHTGMHGESYQQSITEISSGKLLDAARASEKARGKKAVAGDKEGAAKEVKRSSKFFNAALGKVKSKEQQIKTKSEGLSDWRTDLNDLIEIVAEPEGEAQKEVVEKKVKNKVVINPKFTEAVEEMGGELLEMVEVTEEFEPQIEAATEYFYAEGINEEGLDAIIEEVGLDEFVEFVIDSAQDLNEERDARKMTARNLQTLKKKTIPAAKKAEALRKKEGKGEYSAAYKKKETDVTVYDKAKAKVKAKPAAKKVAAVTKQVKKLQPAKKASKQGLGDKIRGAIKKGVARHQAARAKGKEPEKRVKEFGKGFASGVKGAVKFAKDVKKVVSEEELLEKNTYTMKDGSGKKYEFGTHPAFKPGAKKPKSKVKPFKTEYDPSDDDTFDPHEAEATRGQSGKHANPKGKMNVRKRYSEQNELATKEVKDLQKAAKTGKGKYVAKADKVAEDYETKKKSEVMAALKKRTLDKKTKNKIADDIVKKKGDTSKSDDRYAYEGYQRDPEKGEAEAKKADKRSAKQKRMDSPDKGINSPAFKEFMRSRGM